MAERSGLIILLGEWALREACRSCVLWNRAGGATGVCVNVSALQFDLEDFPLKVLHILNEAGLSPSLLTLELTETVLVRDVGRARRHLTHLRREGISVALDDFGTGYSSLSYLTVLPADAIKLDRSFLNRESASATAVIESVVAMAHRLGLRVVAEGVETRPQARRLQQLNCDELQGHYFGEPMPAEQIPQWLTAEVPRIKRMFCDADTRATDCRGAAVEELCPEY